MGRPTFSPGKEWEKLTGGNSGLLHRHDNLSPFKIHDLRLSSQRADNQLAGKSLSHMQTLVY